MPYEITQFNDENFHQWALCQFRKVSLVASSVFGALLERYALMQSRLHGVRGLDHFACILFPKFAAKNAEQGLASDPGGTIDNTMYIDSGKWISFGS